jgi:hypothetical protein
VEQDAHRPSVHEDRRHVRYRLADVIAWEKARTVATRDSQLTA